MKTAALFLIACCCSFAQWTNVTALQPGQEIAVQKKAGGSVSGELVRASDESVVVLSKRQEVAVARADVARVQTKRKGHAKWWGLAIGAGSGAAVGAAAGERLYNESGGDFNFKGAAVAVFAAVGALIGLAIGASLEGRHSTIYHG